MGKEGRRAFQGQGQYVRHYQDKTGCQLEQSAQGAKAGARHEGPGGYTPGLHEERGLSYPRQEPGMKAPAV